MTPVAPIGAGDPDPLDLDAAEELHHNENARLQLVRARAEKWIGGVSALTAVLATALVIKGPEDATLIVFGWRIGAAVALGGAIILLALGTYRAYRAAFGQPSALREISPTPLTGLHNRLTQARRVAADDALRDLRTAIRAVFGAIALIAAAVAITWFATEPPGSLCVYVRSQLVARLSANVTVARNISAGTTIQPCS
jgi:hypothetical protein